MGMVVAPDVYAAGVDWWNERFSDVRDDRVSFSSCFLPALLKSARLELPSSEAFSLDELRVVAKFCVADSAWQHDTISLTSFIHFLARFGPVEASMQRLVESFTVHREIVTWFHGTITRAEAEQALLTPAAAAPLEDGAFLVRFSESQPTKFCLSYVKIHTTGPRAGRRVMRNVLIENAGQTGFVLSDSRSKAYPSIRAFIQRSASRLKHGIASSFARRCNQELAAVRAHQDLISNSYTSFSTESLEPSSTSSPSSPSVRPPKVLPPSLLFAKSPPGSELVLKYGDNQQEHLDQDGEEENYSGFAKSSLIPPPLSVKSTSSMTATGASVVHKPGNAYGSFSSASVVSLERTPPGSPARRAMRKEIPIISPPAGSDYGDFSSFTAAATSFNRVVAAPLSHREPGNSNDEYASFESLMSTSTAGSSSRAETQHTAASSAFADVYGTFDAFDMNSPPPTRPEVVAVAVAATADLVSIAHDDHGDDYGSFATLAAAMSLNGSGGSAPLTTQQSVPSAPVPPRASSNDTCGAFTFSPPPSVPSIQEAAAPGVPPLSLESAASTASASSSLPVSLPADTDGCVDGLVQSTEAMPPALHTNASHSAPTRPDEETDVEGKVSSALDELNTGMEFYKQKRLDDALVRFIRARETAQRCNDLVVEARALGNLGTVYLDQQNPQQAVTCYEQCLAITRSIQDTKRERTILNNLVLALMAAQDFEAAFTYSQVQLETTVSEVNRRKILSRMSLLRERAARAGREERAAQRTATPIVSSSN